MNKKSLPKNIAQFLLGLGACLLISGCSKDMDDLEGWTAEVKQRPGGRIDPLPVIPPYKPYRYPASAGRSPFQPEVEERAEGPGVKPEEDRPREYLEEFPLDSLRMVGTIKPGPNTLALVQDADGLIHRVTTGNYLGQNYGKVVAIEDSEVTVMEIVADGLGGWMERPAALALGQ